MKDYYFLIAQILGFFALVLSIISIIQKSRKRYITFNILQNVFSAMQYLFLYKYIAFYLCLLSIFRLIVYSLKSRFTRSQYIVVLIVFVTLNIFVSLLNFNVWYDIFPLIASTLVCFTVWQSKIIIIRIGCLIAKLLWGIFATISLAYFSIIMDIFIIIWTIIVIVNENKKTKIKI